MQDEDDAVRDDGAGHVGGAAPHDAAARKGSAVNDGGAAPDDGVVARFRRWPVPTLVDDLRIEAGVFDDYKRLSQFHYKGARPGAITSVLRLVHEAPTVVGRYLKRRDETHVVGVLVQSLPHLSCQMRDVATNNRYRGLKRRDAAVMLNREVRTISRVVIDPQWRGLGLAVKLVKRALAAPEIQNASMASALTTSAPVAGARHDLDGDAWKPRYTEALAAMGRVSPFFEQAGMTKYERPPRPDVARLLDALRHAGGEAWATAAPVHQCRPSYTPAIAELLQRELRRWHRAAFRTSTAALHAMSLDDLLAAARSRLFCQPIYYVYAHAPPECLGRRRRHLPHRASGPAIRPLPAR